MIQDLSWAFYATWPLWAFLITLLTAIVLVDGW